MPKCLADMPQRKKKNFAAAYFYFAVVQRVQGALQMSCHPFSFDSQKFNWR